MSSSGEIREFDVSQCFECPVRTQCAVGKLTLDVWEEIDDQIEFARRDAKEGAVLAGYLSDHDEDDISEYVISFRESLVNIQGMAETNRSAINELVPEALKAVDARTWRQIEADPRRVALERIVDEHSELFEDRSSDEALTTVEDIAADVKSYAARNICEAVVRPSQD